MIVVGIFNSLLGNMRWSVSGVPPSGSMRGGGKPDALEFEKKKTKFRARNMQKQQGDLCKPFEMLTRWLYLFFFSLQD